MIAAAARVRKPPATEHTVSERGCDKLLACARPLNVPVGPPLMPPERIVMVLGGEDSVTHIDEGPEFAER